MTDSIDSAAPRRNPLASAALVLALLAALLVLFAGPGTRSGWWEFGTGFTLLRYGAYLGIAAAVAALLAIALGRRWGGRGRIMAVVALALGFIAFFLPWNLRREARKYPGIHDITTDTENPPALVRLAAVREETGATNLTPYEGDSIARIQREAYPDIGPVMMAMPVDSAFALAFNTAREMGWEMAEAEPAEGRIEATATTRWFGFKDDVVIRVRPASGITRLDIRSVSRVGRGDAGANAKRIRAFIRRLPGKVEM